MENAVEALKIAFAMIVFAIAVAVLFMVVSITKKTSEDVLYYTDKTNFYAHTSSKDPNRPVKISDVISTLYKYPYESVAVTVKIPSGTYNFDLSLEENDDQEYIEEKLAQFISTELLTMPVTTEFREEFSEIPISGRYATGEDETEIILYSGGKKVYVTYTKI